MPIPASTELTQFLYIWCRKKLLHPLLAPPFAGARGHMPPSAPYPPPLHNNAVTRGVESQSPESSIVCVGWLQKFFGFLISKRWGFVHCWWYYLPFRLFLVQRPQNGWALGYGLVNLCFNLALYINLQPEYELPSSTRFGQFQKFG